MMTMMMVVTLTMLMTMKYHLNGSMGFSLDDPPLLPHGEIEVRERLKENGLLWGWTRVS